MRTTVVSKPLADEDTVPTVCLIAAVNIVLSVSWLDEPSTVCADISFWLVMLVDYVGLRSSSICDQLTSGSG